MKHEDTQTAMKCPKCRSEDIVVSIEISGAAQYEQVEGVFSEENSIGVTYSETLSPTGKQWATCWKCKTSWELRTPLEKRGNYVETPKKNQ